MRFAYRRNQLAKCIIVVWLVVDDGHRFDEVTPIRLNQSDELSIRLLLNVNHSAIVSVDRVLYRINYSASNS